MGGHASHHYFGGARQVCHLGPQVIKETIEKIHAINDRFKIIQSRQKSYADLN